MEKGSAKVCVRYKEIMHMRWQRSLLGERGWLLQALAIISYNKTMAKHQAWKRLPISRHGLNCSWFSLSTEISFLECNGSFGGWIVCYHIPYEFHSISKLCPSQAQLTNLLEFLKLEFATLWYTLLYIPLQWQLARGWQRWKGIALNRIQLDNTGMHFNGILGQQDFILQ